MTLAGATVFARYAYPPNELGYCGPDDASVLLRPDPAVAEEQIRLHARQFDGAWAYLELIAAGSGIADPLDARVVEAYWIGNDLLDNIDPHDSMTRLKHRFAAQPGATWTPGFPHHSFQVFAVYPWSGLLSKGTNNAVALSILEQCRIRWGRVVAVDGTRVRVLSRPLVLRDGLLVLGEPGEHSAAWSVDGSSLLAPTSDRTPVAVGDHVAMHWDWVCDILTPPQLAELTARSDDQLARTNAALTNSVR
ncbi:MAG: DUF6390 family protein [Actinomycetota bacterium]|nr:DUF6390 family protein [Actinomycetota bacterium]